MYDLGDGARVGTLGRLDRLALAGAAVAPNGSAVAAVSGSSLSLVSATTGEVETHEIKDMDVLSAVAFLPDNRRIAIGSEAGKLVLFDTQTGETRTLASFSVKIAQISSARRRNLLAVRLEGQYGKPGSYAVVDVDTGKPILRPTREGYPSGLNESAPPAFVDNDEAVMFGDGYNIVVQAVATGRITLNQEMRSDVEKSRTRMTWMHAWYGYAVPESPRSDAFWVAAKSMRSSVLYEYRNGRLTPKQGSPEGHSTFFDAATRFAAAMDDGALAVILGRTPKTSRVGEDKFASEHLDLGSEPLAIGAAGAGRFFTIDKNGEIRLYSTGRKPPSCASFSTRTATGSAGPNPASSPVRSSRPRISFCRSASTRQYRWIAFLIPSTGPI